MNFLDETHNNIKYWIASNHFPLKLFFISRIGLFILVYLSLVMIPIADLPGLWRSHPDNLLLDGWSRWDSGYYRDIGTQGYNNTTTQVGQDTAMFPLYPLLIYLFNFFINDVHVAGLLVTNISFLLALIALFHLLSKKYGSKIAQQSLVLICVNPFSFYFSAVYTESIFLLTTACAFYFCEQKQYFLGAFWAALAGATKFVGSILLIPLIVLYLEQIDYDWRKIKPSFLALFISTLGTIFYMTFLATRFGNPLQFIDSQKQWSGQINSLPQIVGIFQSLSPDLILSGNYGEQSATPIHMYSLWGMNLIHLFCLFWAFFLIAFSIKKIGIPYIVFSILTVLISVSRFQGMGRYLLVAFPLFVATAFLLKNKSIYYSYLYFNILLLSLFSIMFSHWYWVA